MDLVLMTRQIREMMAKWAKYEPMFEEIMRRDGENSETPAQSSSRMKAEAQKMEGRAPEVRAGDRSAQMAVAEQPHDESKPERGVDPTAKRS